MLTTEDILAELEAMRDADEAARIDMLISVRTYVDRGQYDD